MSNRAITWAYEQKCGSVGAKSVLVKLADQANDDGLCYPSMDYIARHCECSRRNVSRIIRKLEQLHLVDRHPRMRGGMKTSNEYSLRLPSVANYESSTKSDGTQSISNIKNSTKSDGTPCHIDGTFETPTMGQALSHKPLREPRNKSGAKNAPTGADAPLLSSVGNSFPEKKKSKPARRTLPDFLRPAVFRIIGRLNELAGTAYEIDSKIVQKGLVARLTAGKSESDCLAVVEHKWREWEKNPDMRQHFNPETLFRETNFDKYLNAARMDSAASDTKSAEWRKRTFING